MTMGSDQIVIPVNVISHWIIRYRFIFVTVFRHVFCFQISKKRSIGVILKYYIQSQIMGGFVNFFRIQKKRLPRLYKPVLNMAFFYDDELFLFKQTYLKWRSTLWEQ